MVEWAHFGAEITIVVLHPVLAKGGEDVETAC